MGFTEEQRKEFETLYNSLSRAGTDMKLSQTVDTMIALMLAAGEAMEKQIHVKHCVPHKANRSGALMQIRKIFLKGFKILHVGFSPDRCDPKRAVCFQRNPSDDRDLRRWTDYANKEPCLATFDPNMVEAETVGCGHLNQFLGCIYDEVMVPPEFCYDDGPFQTKDGAKYLDKHQVCKADGIYKKLADVLAKGLTWTYIPYTMYSRYPKLPHMIQKALNVEHHIGEGETWDEQLQGMAAAIVEQCKNNLKGSVDYAAIARTTLASKPPKEIDVPSHMQYCKKYGGGKTQLFVFDVCRYIKLKPNAAYVGGYIFDALNSLKMPADAVCPHFAAALIKCAATRGKSRNGIAAHITEGEVKSIYKNLTLVTEANGYMQKAYQIESTLQSYVSSVTEARGDMECDMVEYILNKMPKEKSETLSLTLLSRAFITKVSGAENIESPSRADADMDELHQQAIFDPCSNVVTQTLNNMGWHIGSIVTPKMQEPNEPKADQQFELGYVNDDGSIGLYTISNDGATDAENVVMTTQVLLAKEYKRVDMGSRLAKLQGSPQDIEVSDVGCYASAALLGLASAHFCKRKCPDECVYIQEKPHVKVIVNEPQRKGSIVFPPCSSGVKPCKEADRGNQPFLVTIQSKKAELGVFIIDKPSSDTFQAVEFWRLRKVYVRDQANMELTTIDVTVPLPEMSPKGLKSVIATIPVATLFKNVNVGDELVLYLPPKDTKKKASACAMALPATCEPIAKKSKNS